MPTFLEFFAGGGMVRAGLGSAWTCSFANDFDEMKAAVYRANWGADHLICEDVAKLTSAQMPSYADLAWASFPCQDLSLAGTYAGIGHPSQKEQTRSGTFWPFWSHMRRLAEEGRAPRIIALENVYGVLRSKGGNDFKAIASAFSGGNYRFGALVIDAARFVPQSRQRVFLIGVRGDLPVPEKLTAASPQAAWHPKALCEAFGILSAEAKRKWIWWNPPTPATRTVHFKHIITDDPKGVRWHTKAETENLIAMMSDRNREKVEAAKRSGLRIVGGVYKRTRIEDGVRVQRAEVRFDDVAGCLRTPAGGSSRQTILVVEGKSVRSRLLAPREAADLMGLPSSYILPSRYNDAYHVAGDGVAVPVVAHLARHVFEPVLAFADSHLSVAAE
ncbi:MULTISPECIES: DNA cytosine methyltransferase [unclassified Yoonia]|uniref:DNA cytosine methyltransferase n=1 Tax=unclassified Yoonia TaxID=2629118 RepID=UPI002AFEBC2B|nr:MULTISPECIES: DNA cytosine methyltransferase [unclassified Yoonia]